MVIESAMGGGRYFANLPAGFRMPQSHVESVLLREYGSVFVARGGAAAPKTIVFKNAADVEDFQSRLETKIENFHGFEIELQAAAMDELIAAASDAEAAGLSLTPRGPDSGKRGYEETVTLWKSRVEPALKHWVENGRMTKAEADSIEELSPFEQVPEIFRLEAEGIYFAKDLSKSIIYSVAPPGTSQHLFMLAFDVSEFENESIRKILARHGWFQTVTSDLPHFTFLGVSENELSGLGLKRVINAEREFWVPDL